MFDHANFLTQSQNNFMTAAEFKLKLRECRSELEVRRLVHWHWDSVTGAYEEIIGCLDAANRIADAFGMSEEGSPGENAPVLPVEEFEVTA
jgi:hypothetical protein